MSQYRPKPQSNFSSKPTTSGKYPSKYPASSQASRGARPMRIPKFMDVDYELMIKKATPQKKKDYSASKTFKEHGLVDAVLKNLAYKGYTQPTEIQDLVIPHILKNKDVIGIANTGTGKTAAFLLPLIDQVYKDPNKTILILAPTRELVNQILAELTAFSHKSRITYTGIIGGENIHKQITALKIKRNFIVSTTGRGLDLIDRRILPIRTIDTIVLDEMDQMLDMGFINDIKKILDQAKSVKHLLFFSATMTKDIEKIALEILKNPVTVSVAKGNTTDNVNQDVIHLEKGQNKMDKLHELLSTKEVKKAIIFENIKHGANKIEIELNNLGHKTLAIHGNKNQNQRNKALNAFKAGQIDYLIATNVAARGLDIPKVSHVINYSLPESREDYIHRIGRTGRAGEEGHAYTFVTHDQVPKERGGRYGTRRF